MVQLLEMQERRRKIFAEIVNPLSQVFLKSAGLRPGARVLDLGCGAGSMTLWMAQQIGPEGHVFALDRDPVQLEKLEREAHKLCLKNITLIEGDAQQCARQAADIDALYSRCFLMHCTESRNLLTTLQDVLSEGTLVFLEEPVLEPPRVSLTELWWKRSMELYRHLCRAQGVDPNYGLRMCSELNSLGYSVYRAMFVQPLISEAQALEYTEAALLCHQHDYSSHGLAAELEELLLQLRHATGRTEVGHDFHGFIQVVAGPQRSSKLRG